MATTYPVRSSTSTQTAISLSYDRPPSPADNASKGYTANSVWQHGGEIFKPATAPSSTAGNWAKASMNGGAAPPGDILGAAVQTMGGVVAMKAGYTGSAIDLTATVSASPVTTTVNILAGGKLDADTVRKVFASADAGTYVYVTKVYDQTGGTNHATLVTSSSIFFGLYLVWDSLLNSYVLASDQSLQTAFNQGLKFAAGLTISENSFGAYFFGRGVNSMSGNSNIIATFGTSTNAFVIDCLEDGVGPSVTGWDPSGSRSPAPTGTAWAPLDCRPCVVSGIGATNSLSYAVNENGYTLNVTPPATARTSGFIGAWDLNTTNRFLGMRMLGFCVANTTPTAAQDRAIRNWFYAQYDVKPQARDRVFFITDSRGGQVMNTNNSGTKGTAGMNVTMLLAEALKSDCEVINVSQGSATNAVLGTIAVPGVVKMYRAGVKNVAVLLIGVNDFIASSLTAAQSVSALAGNVSTLRAAGYTTVVIAELSTTNGTGSASTAVPQLRTLINAGQSTADYVVDVSGIDSVSTPATAAYYGDGLHPTECVSRLVASRVASVVDAILAAT